ncbi:MAG: AmmeMemoRadiSam system radical SAM enzyme [Candidatus Brocadiae bacterium]|nr:AmmeMemoRadiSam system radical SAM enzyme [Candidatus Brocadiia bacterium]
MAITAAPRADVEPIDRRLGLPPHPARLWTSTGDGRVRCHLCPRRCSLAEGEYGFCKVRKNDAGRLVTLNYGISVQLTEEVIETEAVYHLRPGARILSLGNVGCMMACTFCQNWATSQAVHVREEDVRRYTPEQVVETALAHGIGILSWTYNDPVVWHEFVLDTARLAKRHGLLNLYKSAFSIGAEAIEELCEVIDIFSLSLKSMDPVFYSRMTRARLEPVLDAIRQVRTHRDRHLELSNLLVTGANDNLTEGAKVARWVLDELGDDVPLHFVRFHPAYQYTAVGRTSIDVLKAVREQALRMGVKHCYLGNVPEAGPWTDTSCGGCGAVLVRRFGLVSSTPGLNASGCCSSCGRLSPVVPGPTGHGPAAAPAVLPGREITHLWHGESTSGHVSLQNLTGSPRVAILRPDLRAPAGRAIPLRPGEQWRLMVSREHPDSPGAALSVPDGVQAEFWDVLDRAHFPTAQEMRP